MTCVLLFLISLDKSKSAKGLVKLPSGVIIRDSYLRCVNKSSQVRFYSTIPNNIVYKDFKDITADVLNNLLKNQKVFITEAELAILKNIPSVRFKLPLNDQTRPSFEGLVGKPHTRGIKAGVYIFTDKLTGCKYVGSSNSLSRRLDQYFNFKHFNQNLTGLLLPIINKE